MAQIIINILDKEIDLVTSAICDNPNATVQDAEKKILENIQNTVTAYIYRGKVAVEKAKLEQAQQDYDLAVTQIVVDEVAVSIV